jgi:cytochrome P450
VRRCIGASFVQVEMRVVLRRERLRAPSQAPERAKSQHVTVVPARGCRVVVEERLVDARAANGLSAALA